MLKIIKSSNKVINSQAGFTLIELLISTSVFTVVLLISTIAIIFVSKNYSQGQINIQTQSNAESIVQNISNDLKFTNLTTSTIVTNQQVTITGTTYYYFCIGTNVYTYDLNTEYNTSGGSGIGLIETVNAPNCKPYLTGGKQLLSNKERIGLLNIQPTTNGGSYEISMTIAYGNNYGSNGVLKYLATSATSYSYSCLISSFSLSFCYTSSLYTIVTPRIS